MKFYLFSRLSLLNSANSTPFLLGFSNSCPLALHLLSVTCATCLCVQASILLLLSMPRLFHFSRSLLWIQTTSIHIVLYHICLSFLKSSSGLLPGVSDLSLLFTTCSILNSLFIAVFILLKPLSYLFTTLLFSLFIAVKFLP
jgi:hypothetical protein